MREANGLRSRSSGCPVSSAASARSSCVGTICLCVNRIAKCGPYSVPLASGSFRRISRISSSVGHGCPQSGPVRSTGYSTRTPCRGRRSSRGLTVVTSFNSFSIHSFSTRYISSGILFASTAASVVAFSSTSSAPRRATSA